ncbi:MULTISPECIES: hypothetical protein [unclassified Streptomyces]|uniref:hypothetical protein n=1 Tax=unclassified Streptomyces TaxID=2593676 RepID=UPI000DAE4E10|nr:MULTISPECIES: hypothetical protein [unclassified Streptomyces]PZT73791.1 hypothetical protein DNK55_16370 [Streptomyces sp. AC1-42T]PZT83212.1 hypothetical protein DNK56_15055 [Streptomyces sp. AC1-42W]
MRYTDMLEEVRRAAAAAAAGTRSALARETLGRLLADPEVDRAAADDLDDAARAALHDLRIRVSAGPRVVRESTASGAFTASGATEEATPTADSAAAEADATARLLATVDAGTLADGDMGAELLAALEAAEAWRAYLGEAADRHLVDIARISLAAADFRHPAPTSDMLSSPEVAAEFQRIQAALAP